MEYMCDWEYKEENSNPDHTKFITGYGINLLTGFTTFYETFDERNLFESHKRLFYSLCKGGMPKFKQFLQPHTIFRIVIGDVNPRDSYIAKSTLLYVDADKKVMVITRKMNRLIKPMLYIWLITHNLLRTIPEDEYLQKMFLENKEIEKYKDMKNYNLFSSTLATILRDDNSYENPSNYEKGTFKMNFYDYLKLYLTTGEKRELFKKLTERENIILSYKELETYSEHLRRMYKKLKWNTKENYILFPLYKMIIYANYYYDGMGPIKAKKVTKLTTSTRYLI